MQQSIHIFYSYAHEDERLQKRLDKHLSLLQGQGFAVTWHDRNISAGTEWENEIDTHLDTAHIILLLVSANFLASQYCYSVEMSRALERHASGSACVIPIILRPVDWQRSPIGALEALPTGARPVTGRGWKNLDEAFTNIAQGIRRVIEELHTSVEVTSRVAKPHRIWSKSSSLFVQPSSPKILIIDDEAPISYMSNYHLSREGFRVECAKDGLQGLIAAQRTAPDLILLDLAMPVVEGFEVIRRLQASPITRRVPILVLTAHEDEEYRIGVFKLGVNDYMTKTCGVSKILERVRTILYREDAGELKR